MAIFKREEKNNFLVLSFESGIIYGSILEKNSGNLFANFSEEIKSSKEQALVTALGSILKKISDKKIGFEDIHLIFSTPWILSKTKSIFDRFPTAQNVDSAYIQKTLEKNKNDLLNELKELGFNSEYEFDLECIEQKVFEIKINGYPIKVNKPIKASTFEISHTDSFMSKNVVNKLLNSISHFFIHKKVHFHSALVLAYIKMRDLEAEYESGIFVYIHDECTDLAIFKQGIPFVFQSTACGSSSLLKLLSHKFSISYELAKSKVSMYEKNELPEKERAKMEKIINEHITDWCKLLAESITELQKDSTLPKTIFFHSKEVQNLYISSLSKILGENSKIIEIGIPKLHDLHVDGLLELEFHSI